MNNDHYGIVIGLRNYAGFTNPPANLRGPENDADDVHRWLTNPLGGGLPESNVVRIKSSDDDPPALKPSRETLETKAFKWIDKFAKDNQAAGRGRRVGQRLYVYMSGHGFSPQIRQGCLLAGNASPEEVSANIGASLWLQWWQDAGYFREYVLLLDCCMNRMLAGVAEASRPPLNPTMVPDASGPTFVAFAAQRPLKAVEVAIPPGGETFHGVFTWAFLRGLEGAAANAQGVVNGHSMANWLRNAILPWLSETDRSDPDVSKEPEIVAEDPRLIFARGVARLLFDVTLEFPPDAIGQTARLWSGVVPQPTDFQVQAQTTHKLPAGLHLVEVPGAGYRQGLEVVRADKFTIAEKGAPVAPPPPGTLASLVVEPDDFSATVSLIAADFDVVDAVGGRLVTKLPFGLYKTQIRIGRQLVTRVALLDRDTNQSTRQPAPGDMIPESVGAARAEAIVLPRIASAVPFRDAPLSHEYQFGAAASAAATAGPAHVSHGQGAELMVMARSWTKGGVSPQAEPWKGIQVVDAKGKVVADLETDGVRTVGAGMDPLAFCTIAVAPGTYFLHHPLEPAQRLEQALVAARGWRLEAYVLRRLSSDAVGDDVRPRLSLLMRQPGQGLRESEDELLEKARVALADERPILGPELDDLLVRKFENPIEGIIGGHLLLIQNERDKRGRLDDLNTVVRNLRNLVGDSHPDVEALSLRCPDEALRRRKAFSSPPMFERSWRMIVEASQNNSKLVPLGLWERVHALASVPPFLVWSIDASVQKAYREALVRIAMGDEAEPTGEVLVGPAAEMALPGEVVLESMAEAVILPDRVESRRAKPRKPVAETRRVRELSQTLQLPPAAVRSMRDTRGG